MAKYYLNPYLPVISDGAQLSFPLEQGESQDLPLTIEAKKAFSALREGRGLTEAELLPALGEERLKRWETAGILLPYLPDTAGRDSRSSSYFYLRRLPRVQALLKSKTVLILGCGGVGTHAAWNLAALGGGKLVLLDCDAVELSNLNRQLLYDVNDIGKQKVEVLEQKLHKVNPNIVILTVDRRIDSQEALSEVVLQHQPDCIVKSLDVPMYVSDWVDAVCAETGTCYISSIMNGTQQLVGPTYTGPGSARFGDFFSFRPEVTKVSGLGPSISFELSEMGAKVAEEVFKLLTGAGKLRYKDCIELTETISDERTVLTAPAFPQSRDGSFALCSVSALLVLAVLFFTAQFLSFSSLLVAGLILLYALAVPLFFSGTVREAMMHCCVLLCFGVTLNLVFLALALRPVLQSGSLILGMISIGFTVLSLQMLLCAGLEYLLFQVLQAFKINHYQRRRN